MSTAATVFLSLFGGGSLVALFQFLLTRHDSKKEKNDETLQEVKSIKKDLSEIKTEMEERFDQIDRKVDDGKAIQARARVLRFSDEVQTGRKFSRNAWNQTFQDITDYEAHCKKHKDFKNSQAVEEIANVRIVYKQLQERERRGEEVFL